MASAPDFLTEARRQGLGAGFRVPPGLRGTAALPRSKDPFFRAEVTNPFAQLARSPLFAEPSEEAFFRLDSPAFQRALEGLRTQTAQQFNLAVPGALSAAAARGFQPGSGIEAALLGRLAGGASRAFSAGAQGLIERERALAFQRFMDQLAAARQARLLPAQFRAELSLRRLARDLQRQAQSRAFLGQLLGTVGQLGGAALPALLPGLGSAGAGGLSPQAEEAFMRFQ